MVERMLRGLRVIVLAYAGLCLLLWALQRGLIYMPHGGSPLPPGTSRLVLDAADGVQLHVTVRPGTDPAAALVYFGGNAEDVHFSLPDLQAAQGAHTLYLAHYRGYGGSGGRPSEAALVADAILLLDAVTARHAARAITVVGRSLGSGVAVQAAAARPDAVQRLVLITPFDSLVTVAQSHYPFVPVRWLLKDRFDSASRAPGLALPVTMIVAERDEIVPLRSTQALHGAFAAGQASWHLLPGTGHNDLQRHPDYLALLRGTR